MLIELASVFCHHSHKKVRNMCCSAYLTEVGSGHSFGVVSMQSYLVFSLRAVFFLPPLTFVSLVSELRSLGRRCNS